ncbi:MAG: Hsp20/alpha crystallin family protein [Desulfobacterales bacterium]|jgi:HSP20 family molecular chaperone IbpA
MAEKDEKELQVKEKQEVATPAEQTRPGLVFEPNVDIFETESEITLLADMPGVKADDLTIDLRDNTLTLSGDVPPIDDSNQELIAVEYQTGRYYRQFTLSEVIDQTKIDAKLNDGVLRLTLPKVEKAAPRKITVKAG